MWSYCKGVAIRGRTLTLKVKYADFRQVTRSRTVDAPVASRAEVEAIVSALLKPLFPVSKGIRLLGATLSSLVTGTETGVEQQLRLPNLRRSEVPAGGARSRTKRPPADRLT